jgi:hypothetical protein
MALRIFQFLAGLALAGAGGWLTWTFRALAGAVFPPDPGAAAWPLIGGLALFVTGLVLAVGAFLPKDASSQRRTEEAARRQAAIAAADAFFAERARAADRDWRSGDLPPETPLPPLRSSRASAFSPDAESVFDHASDLGADPTHEPLLESTTASSFLFDPPHEPTTTPPAPQREPAYEPPAPQPVARPEPAEPEPARPPPVEPEPAPRPAPLRSIPPRNAEPAAPAEPAREPEREPEPAQPLRNGGFVTFSLEEPSAGPPPGVTYAALSTGGTRLAPVEPAVAEESEPEDAPQTPSPPAFSEEPASEPEPEAEPDLAPEPFVEPQPQAVAPPAPEPEPPPAAPPEPAPEPPPAPETRLRPSLFPQPTEVARDPAFPAPVAAMNPIPTTTEPLDAPLPSSLFAAAPADPAPLAGDTPLARIRAAISAQRLEEADRLLSEERTRLNGLGDGERLALAELTGLAGDHAAAAGRIGGAKWLWRLALQRFAAADAIASPAARAVSDRLRLADQ